MLEADITKVVEEMAVCIRETEEDFILDTIFPYCQETLRKKINKAELKQIILRGSRPKGKWIAIHDESEDIHTINCSCCGYRLVGVLNSGFTKEQALDCAKDEIKNAPFCCKCGAEMSGGGEE